MKGVIVKAPAKLVITGDYSALYNGKIITCAINKFMILKIKTTKNKKIKITGNGFKIKVKIDNFSLDHQCNDFILEIIRYFFNETKIEMTGINISIKSQIPVNCGIGSSSALICGILYGLNELFLTELTENNIIKIATKLETICYGKSNKIDSKTTISGGVLVLNEDNQIKRIPHSFNDIYFINTGRPRSSSKEVINIVGKNTKHMSLYNDFQELANNIEQDIKNGIDLTAQIAFNNKLLEKLGVISDKALFFIQTLLSYNIYAKLCGYGTIANMDTNGNSGVIGIFQKISRLQRKVLKKVSRRFGWKLKKVRVINSGIEIEYF